MRVAVIGAGGVGGFLGSLLARAGHDVRFLARGPHLHAIRERGLQLRSKQFGEFIVDAPATDNPAELGQSELVLVTVKMYDFAAAAQAAKAALALGGMAVTMQNGLDAPYELASVVGRDRVLVGTAAIEATVLEPGVVGHLVPLHQMTLCELEGGPTPRLEKVVAELQAARINAAVGQDGYQALWDKALMLIPLATFTTAADAGLAQLIASPEATDLVEQLSDEAVAVARAAGHDPSRPALTFKALVDRMAPTAPAFTSSMNRDARAGRRLELEWLTGKLLRVAAEKGVAVPAHRALYAVLKAKTAPPGA